MFVVIAYDVNTETPQGRRRLRRVAKACEGRGQRVQKSVFECRVNRIQFEALRNELLDIIEDKIDRLRFYTLPEPFAAHIQVYGADDSVDFDQPLVL